MLHDAAGRFTKLYLRHKRPSRAGATLTTSRRTAEVPAGTSVRRRGPSAVRAGTAELPAGASVRRRGPNNPFRAEGGDDMTRRTKVAVAVTVAVGLLAGATAFAAWGHGGAAGGHEAHGDRDDRRRPGRRAGHGEPAPPDLRGARPRVRRGGGDAEEPKGAHGGGARGVRGRCDRPRAARGLARPARGGASARWRMPSARPWSRRTECSPRSSARPWPPTSGPIATTTWADSGRGDRRGAAGPAEPVAPPRKDGRAPTARGARTRPLESRR